MLAGELALGFVVGRKGGNCWWIRRWDLTVVAKLVFVGRHGQGILGGRGDGIRWRSQSWVLLAGAEIMTGKLIES